LSELRLRVLEHDGRLTNRLTAAELENLRSYLKRIYEQ
jgi:hypothetical protein